MANMIFPAKDPVDVIELIVDWSRYLGHSDKIVDLPILVTSPEGLTVRDLVVEGSLLKFWCEGGTAGQSYKLSCTITTERGRTVNRTATIEVADL